MSTIDEARDALLTRIKRDALRVPAGDLRNLATAYGTLTERKLDECRLAGPVTDLNGETFFVDARGCRVNASDVPKS